MQGKVTFAYNPNGMTEFQMGAFNNTILKDDAVLHSKAIGIIPTQAGYTPQNNIDITDSDLPSDIDLRIAAHYPGCRAIDITE